MCRIVGCRGVWIVSLVWLGAMEMEVEKEQTEGADEGVELGVEKKVRVKVLLFARARELAGGSEFDLSVADGSTTADCVAELTTRFAALEVMRESIVVALNFNYITDPVEVKDGDELAIIPPISGG